MSRFLLCLLLVTLSFDMISCYSIPVYGKYHVEFVNALGHGKTLRVHCKSKNDDLGDHYLTPTGHYEFDFHLNIKLSTLFFCNLWQGPHYEHHAVFDAYVPDGDFIYDKCGDSFRCTWEAREDGVYIYNTRSLEYKFMHKWETLWPKAGFAPLSPYEEKKDQAS